MSNTLNIEMDQGSTLEYTFTFQTVTNEPVNITGFDARLHVRKTYSASSPVITATITNTKLTVVNAAAGILKLTLTPDDTKDIRFASRDDESLECVYDLEIISPVGKVYKPARGAFTIRREVTR